MERSPTGMGIVTALQEAGFAPHNAEYAADLCEPNIAKGIETTTVECFGATITINHPMKRP